MIGFAFGVAGILILAALVAAVRARWPWYWPPLLVVAEFVVAMLGLIAAVPAAQQRQDRRAFALCAIVLNALCLLALLGLVVLSKVVAGAG
jgi:hypothetical protein